MTIYFKKVKDNAIIPSFGHNDDSNMGIDLFACLDRITIIPAKGHAVIPTGVAWQPFEVPYNHKAGMLIQSRSGLAIKDNIEASNAGVVDQDYRGEIMVKLYNHGNKEYVIEHGMRIAQGVVMAMQKYAVVEVTEIDETTRGSKGFGSSGVF